MIDEMMDEIPIPALTDKKKLAVRAENEADTSSVSRM